MVGLGQIEEAQEALIRALAVLREMSGRWHFVNIATMLAELGEEMGNEAVTTELYQEACITFDFIIEHIPTNGLRDWFK